MTNYAPTGLIKFTMAYAKVSSLIDEIKGKTQTAIFANKGDSRFTVYQRTFKRRKTQTAFEQLIRARVSECAKYWTDSLAVATRDGWEAYAPTIACYTCTKGDIIRRPIGPYTGLNAFIAYNVNLLTSGFLTLGTFQSTPPIGIPPPGCPLTLAAVWNPVTKQIDVTWTLGPPVQARARIWVRSKGLGCQAQITVTQLYALQNAQITNVRLNPGFTFPLADLKGLFDVQLDGINLQGVRSCNSNLVKSVRVN